MADEEPTVRRDLTRWQFERAAQLADRDDEYSRRWSLVHEAMAEAAASGARG